MNETWLERVSRTFARAPLRSAVLVGIAFAIGCAGAQSASDGTGGSGAPPGASAGGSAGGSGAGTGTSGAEAAAGNAAAGTTTGGTSGGGRTGTGASSEGGSGSGGTSGGSAAGAADTTSSGGSSGSTAGTAGASGGGVAGAGAQAGGSGGNAGAPATGGSSGAGGTSTSEGLHYYGRWNQLADRAITVNSGSHIVARFSGTGVSARFDVGSNQSPNPTLAWKIDSTAWQEGELAAKLPLGNGLASGLHEVTLMVRGLNEKQSRWTPPLISSITFLGFEVTGGSIEPSPRPSRPKIEFLGDSITEGVAVWSSHNGQSTPCWRADGRIAYASQTAQLLNAEWRQVGFGRQGLLIGGNGGVPTANDAFNWIYQGVRRDSWLPDLVVVNQGTNDSASSSSLFRPAYTTYLKTIRAAYPDAKIAAMRPFGGAHAADIKAEVDAHHDAGDNRVYFIDTTGWLVSSDFTDGTHPNAQGSTKAAQALAAALQKLGAP